MKIFDDEKDKLLDHDYDGIKELDNHMPVWWLWLFYFTIGWGFLYMVYYQWTGVGPDQHEQYEMEIAAVEEKYGSGGDEESTASAAAWEIETDAASIENGKALYDGVGNLCFTCHGAAGEGLVGPNLTDDFWLHGCSAEEIAASIINGYPDKGMMPYGSGARIADDDLTDIISYIASIQGTNPANPKAVDETRAVECTID